MSAEKASVVHLVCKYKQHSCENSFSWPRHVLHLLFRWRQRLPPIPCFDISQVIPLTCHTPFNFWKNLKSYAVQPSDPAPPPRPPFKEQSRSWNSPSWTFPCVWEHQMVIPGALPYPMGPGISSPCMRPGALSQHVPIRLSGHWLNLPPEFPRHTLVLWGSHLRCGSFHGGFLVLGTSVRHQTSFCNAVLSMMDPKLHFLLVALPLYPLLPPGASRDSVWSPLWNFPCETGLAVQLGGKARSAEQVAPNHWLYPPNPPGATPQPTWKLLPRTLLGAGGQATHLSWKGRRQTIALNRSQP